MRPKLATPPAIKRPVASQGARNLKRGTTGGWLFGSAGLIRCPAGSVSEAVLGLVTSLCSAIYGLPFHKDIGNCVLRFNCDFSSSSTCSHRSDETCHALLHTLSLNLVTAIDCSWRRREKANKKT